MWYRYRWCSISERSSSTRSLASARSRSSTVAPGRRQAWAPRELTRRSPPPPRTPIRSPTTTTPPTTSGTDRRYCSPERSPFCLPSMAWTPAAAASASMHVSAMTARPSGPPPPRPRPSVVDTPDARVRRVDGHRERLASPALHAELHALARPDEVVAVAGHRHLVELLRRGTAPPGRPQRRGT